jgi:hypothetical protein
MHQSSPRPVVHLELHTGDQARASAVYAKLLCWRPQLIEAGSGSYLALELGGGFGGGIVECGTARPLWLPYVQVGQDAADSDPVRFWRHVVAALDRARPGIAERVSPLLGPPAPPTFEGLVTALVNELEAEPSEAEVLLVLDDYHLIDAQLPPTAVPSTGVPGDLGRQPGSNRAAARCRRARTSSCSGRGR